MRSGEVEEYSRDGKGRMENENFLKESCCMAKQCSTARIFSPGVSR